MVWRLRELAQEMSHIWKSIENNRTNNTLKPYRMKTKVKFIKAYYLDELESKVNNLLFDGWKIQGNLVWTNDVFYIALIIKS